MIRIPVPAVLSKRTVGTTVAAAMLAGTSAISATPASASVPRAAVSSAFACTATAPELCVGINYSGTHVYTMQAQVNVNQRSNVLYSFYAFVSPISVRESGGPGWVQPPATVQINHDFSPGEEFCTVASVNSTVTTLACVDLP
ncbi:MAG TPA: hypothetical protein VF070_44710 [Streptosporangiaceae bacterium]